MKLRFVLFSGSALKRRWQVIFVGPKPMIIFLAIGAVIHWVSFLSSATPRMDWKIVSLCGGVKVAESNSQRADRRDREALEKPREPEPQEMQAPVQAKVEPEKIVAGPRNIKEKTAIYVFLGWLWVSIGVCVYILRLKIKEADRLHNMKFFSPERKQETSE